MRKLSLALSAGAAIALAIVITPGTASASYMSECNTLIEKWETCKETQEDCTTQTKAIVEQCKCHRLRQGEWKLVMAAVGKDGVCAPEWPPTDVPDPSPPPHPDRTDNADEQKGNKDGEQRGDH